MITQSVQGDILQRHMQFSVKSRRVRYIEGTGIVKLHIIRSVWGTTKPFASEKVVFQLSLQEKEFTSCIEKEKTRSGLSGQKKRVR